MDPLLILIDGYNVIKNIPGLAAAERQSLEAGRDALVQQIRARYRQTPHRVVVVFDGVGDTERVSPIARMPRGQIVFTRSGESADSVIQRRAAQERAGGATVYICSDDLEVRTGAAAMGGHAVSVRQLAEKLSAPDRHQRRLSLTRQYLKRQWNTDDDEAHTSRARGSRRRAKHRASHRDELP